MLRCKEVTRLVASEDLLRAPLRLRLSLRLHLLMCRHCRRYVREMQAIGAVARRHAAHLFGVEPHDEERVSRLASIAAQEIENQKRRP